MTAQVLWILLSPLDQADLPVRPLKMPTSIPNYEAAMWLGKPALALQLDGLVLGVLIPNSPPDINLVLFLWLREKNQPPSGNL